MTLLIPKVNLWATPKARLTLAARANMMAMKKSFAEYQELRRKKLAWVAYNLIKKEAGE